MTTQPTDTFHTATDVAFSIIWAALVGHVGERTMRNDQIVSAAVHNFAITACSRIAGIIEPTSPPASFGPDWGRSYDDVIAAAEAASVESGRSVDSFIRVFDRASEETQVRMGEGVAAA